MEICDAIVMFPEITPDFHGTAAVTVEGSVDQLYLGNPSVQKKLQLAPDRVQRAKTHALINRGQAVAAPERTAPACLIVKDSVLKFSRAGIKKGNPIHIHRLSAGSGPAAEHKSRNFLQPLRGIASLLPLLPVHIIPEELPEGLLPLSQHDPLHHGKIRQKLFRLEGDLRAAQPQPCGGQHLRNFQKQLLNRRNIPDIAGEADHIRISSVQIAQDFLHPVIDSVLRQLDKGLQLLPRKGPQAVNCGVGMDILRVDRRQQKLHETFLPPNCAPTARSGSQ